MIKVRVTIPEVTEFLTLSMAAFCDNTQALYDIFENVLTITDPPQNSITITVQAKLLKSLEGAKEITVEVLIFTTHAHCFKLNVIC